MLSSVSLRISSIAMLILILLVSCVRDTLATEGLQRGDCSTSFFTCETPGAISDTIGLPGSGWKGLYSDIVSSINETPPGDAETSINDTEGPAKRDGVFCCAKTSKCLLLKVYRVPMCWDRFTTNVYFPDGAHGTIVNGSLSTAAGDSADLVYGSFFRKDGTVGNIYDEGDETTLPDTQTMDLPTPWTSSGVGTPIPATELGTTAVLSTTVTLIPATTLPPVTLPSLTVTMIATMTGCGHCVGNNTTIAGVTIPASTRPESTGIFTTGVAVPPFTGTASHLYAFKTISTYILVAIMQYSML